VSTVGWIIVLILVIPMIGVLVWVVIAASIVRVPSGSIGLLMVKGRATDTTLLPGSHFVPALRRRMIEEYPSVELAYRAGGPGDSADGGKPFTRNTSEAALERSGPLLPVTLGDRTTATVAYTVRFRLLPEQLKQVHERFGPTGVFGIVRDESSRAVTGALGDPAVGIDSLLGSAREACEKRLFTAVGAALQADGVEVTAFLVGAVDLGRTGEVIQATLRARLEVEREKAEAATRMARALNDADLQQYVNTASDAAWRYRETDLWRDLVQRTGALSVALRAVPGAAGGTTAQETAEDQSQPVNPT